MSENHSQLPPFGLLLQLRLRFQGECVVLGRIIRDVARPADPTVDVQNAHLAEKVFSVDEIAHLGEGGVCNVLHLVDPEICSGWVVGSKVQRLNSVDEIAAT